MAKVHSGQRDPDGTLVVKSSTVGGMRQIRCPQCGGMAVPFVTAQGVQVFRCNTGACGAEFRSRPL